MIQRPIEFFDYREPEQKDRMKKLIKTIVAANMDFNPVKDVDFSRCTGPLPDDVASSKVENYGTYDTMDVVCHYSSTYTLTPGYLTSLAAKVKLFTSFRFRGFRFRPKSHMTSSPQRSYEGFLELNFEYFGNVN